MRFKKTSLLSLLLASFTSAEVHQLGVDEKHAASLISWLKAKNGFFHSNLEMRRIDPEDPTSFFGMFAKDDIKEGSLMLRIPTDIIINSREENPELTPMVCPLVFSLLDEIRLKDASEYAPYINYLLETQPPGQLPSAWSNAGKELLMYALGDYNFSVDRSMRHLKKHGNLGLANELPPMDPIGWIEHEFYNDCKGTSDPLAEYAALLVIQRAWDDILIPVYDMMSHRNPPYLNTKSDESGVHSGLPVRVAASRDIQKGEQIYTTYNMCEDCGARREVYGTPEIFRDYGFVEQYPRTWIFNDINVGFRVDEHTEKSPGGETMFAVTEWINGEPNDEDIEDLENKLAEIRENKEILDDRDAFSDVPEKEWDMIEEYMNAMEEGIEIALKWIENSKASDSCIENGTCTVSKDRYTDLDQPYETELEEYYSAATCDINQQFRVFDDGTYEEIDSFKSQYQQINFLYNAETRDTCMDLDDTVQICDAYRPHYHEYAVHQTARFMPKDSIKRVLFVGGGDSMLLHETLKYDSLELVVGLELDQKVVRGCFKHFGTQPHFHDSRVEWWFGDAAKSLLMLPKEYFGSFDLVLVDLSETVMSFKVTDELDVLDSLTLLVKPDGIFVKNEVYFSKFKNMFPYTAQVHWYDNPIICSQVMVMGSRTIDFMKPILTNHETDNLVVRELDDIDDNFELYHDYAFNATSHHLCDDFADKEADSTQNRSPGILMVVEVEHVEGDINAESLQKKMVESLSGAGFKVEPTSNIVEDGANNIITILMAEGYVVARSMADLKYVGLDIHLWSSMDKQEEAKAVLITAVGGSIDSVSTYRVIAGGMFGVDSWQKDEALRGPQFKELCQAVKDTTPVVETHEGDVSKDDIKIALEQSLKVSEAKNKKVAILTSNVGSSISKAYVDMIKSFESVKEVVEINCPVMAKYNEFSEAAAETLTACEKHLYDALKKTAADGLVNAIVIDPAADKATASILLKLFSARRKDFLYETLATDSLIISTQFDKDDESWKKHLLLLFLDEVFVDAPCSFSEVLFVNSKSDGEFSVLMTNDGGDHFIGNLNSTVAELNALEGDLTASVEVINGGEWLYQENFKPSRSYLPSDYNQTAPLAQWKTQNPTGLQLILQLESTQDAKKVKVTSDVLKQAVTTAINDMALKGVHDIQTFESFGDGVVMNTVWSGGSLIVLWDGRSHIDVNLFTFVEDVHIGNTLERAFMRVLPSFQTMLRDEQPRGTGNVVAYKRDLKDNAVPHWA